MTFRQFVYSSFLLLAALPVWAQGPGPGDAPTPRPPAPLPRGDVPRRIPDPPTRPGMTIPGRVLTGQARLPDQIMEVRIESSGQARLAFAYTDGTGEFVFRDVRFQPTESYFIVVEAEGFKPYRERLQDFVDRSFGGYLALFLTPEVPEPEDAIPGGGLVVDVGQLMLDIPGDVRDDFAQAEVFASEGRYQEAAERLETVVERVPEFFSAYESLGMAYLWLERFEDAADALARAHQLSPRSSGPLLNLGTLHYREGEALEIADDVKGATVSYEAAVEVLGEAIDLDPFSAPAYLRLGAAHYKLGSLEEAEETLVRALELDSELADTRLVLINVYSRQGKFRQVLDQVELYEAANPESEYGPALDRLRVQIESQEGTTTP